MSHRLVTAAAKTPFIDWATLGKVVGVSFAFGVAIVVLFALGIVGLGWFQGEPPEAGGAATLSRSGSRAAGLALASLCLTTCAAAVVYGLYLIIPQFHGK
jgi:hypothetical protein